MLAFFSHSENNYVASMMYLLSAAYFPGCMKIRTECTELTARMSKSRTSYLGV